MPAIKNESESNAATSSAISKNALEMKRHLRAPRELVYKAWTQPEHMLKWYAPAHAITLAAESDTRVGGRYRVLMRTDDGNEHDVSGVFREVVLNEKLVFTWTWTAKPERASLVTVEFASEPGGTLMTFRHEQFFDEVERDDHANGWAGALDKLVALVSKQ